MKVFFNNILRNSTVLTYASCATIQAKRGFSSLPKMPGPITKTMFANTPFGLIETPVYAQRKATGKVCSIMRQNPFEPEYMTNQSAI